MKNLFNKWADKYGKYFPIVGVAIADDKLDKALDRVLDRRHRHRRRQEGITPKINQRTVREYNAIYFAKRDLNRAIAITAGVIAVFLALSGLGVW